MFYCSSRPLAHSQPPSAPPGGTSGGPLLVLRFRLRRFVRCERARRGPQAHGSLPRPQGRAGVVKPSLPPTTYRRSRSSFWCPRPRYPPTKPSQGRWQVDPGAAAIPDGDVARLCHLQSARVREREQAHHPRPAEGGRRACTPVPMYPQVHNVPSQPLCAF